jgi:3-oxoacyl-[acyl-carrier-protein] synthase III
MTNHTINARAHRGSVSEIVATGFAYPRDVVDNDAFFERCRFPITDDREALIRETRMKTRYWCTQEENTWTLAKEAVEMALQNGAVSRSEIDVVIVSSCSTIPMVNFPDPQNPVVADLAPLVLKLLGRDDAVGFDLKAAYCAGFIRAMEVMDSLLGNPNYRAGLLVATDVGGRFATAETNRSAFCFVIGDAAGAMVLKKRFSPPTKRTGILDFYGLTVPSKGDLTAWGPDGRSILVRGNRAASATVELLVGCARRLLERNKLSPEEVDWLLPMQTHAGAIEAVKEALGWPDEKILWFGDVTGYAASASIPACFAAQIHKGKIQRGDLVLSLAVGAGMNAAGALYYY